MFMGVLFVHWTTVWVRVELLEVGPPPVRGTERVEIHQTSCLNTLLYTSQMIQDGPLQLEGGVQQSWLFSFVHSKLILLETTKTKTNSKTLQ